MAMANLPSPTKVSGKFNAIYEAYYKLLDPKGLGTIEAMVAAKFLKKSGLSDVVLSRIWDLSDPTGRGYLDKEGLFVSLKLVALAQAGHDINMRNIFIEPPNPPKVGEIPKIQPPKIMTVLPHTKDWSIAPIDRIKYDALFESLLPVDGLLPGNKVRSVLMDSKLPLDALSRIWDLADQDKDGSLDKHEFLVAMHLVYQALEKKTIPASLPVELQRPKFGAAAPAASGDNGFVANFPTNIAPPPVPPLPVAVPPLIPPMPMRPTMPAPAAQIAPLIPTDLLIQTGPTPMTASHSAVADWVVGAADKQRFDAMFKRSDLDNDGLVSGLEIKDVFLQSGIPQLCLAQIWALCDTAQSGKLTAEQFALAMWMVERKRMGYEPPEALTGNMVPPSQRAPTSVGGGAADLVGLDATNLMQATPAEQAYANPELAMIAKEIEELVRERRQLESDVTQREADIRIKNGEVRSLQSELDTLAATLKQLENQKGEAQKRLDDLKAQTVAFDREREIIIDQLSLANEQVNKIRDKCQKQEETIHEMASEVDSKRGELQKLKDEETSLEREYDANKHELDKVSQNMQDTKLQISQIKSMVTQLQESQRQMSDALAICKSAIETNNPTVVSDYTLKMEPEFRDIQRALEKKDEKPTESAYHSNGQKSGGDPFGASANTSTTSGFASTFGAPGGGSGGFDDSFGSSFGGQKSRHDDPFHSSATGAPSADPFGDKAGENKAITPDPNKDDFGSDPFAILHAPTSASQIVSPAAHAKSSGGPPPRPESPSPALPPKKAKQPPPRPAPPRPSMGPTPTRPEPPSHGFGGNPTTAGGFADFANFDDITSTPPQSTTTNTTNTTNNIPSQSASTRAVVTTPSTFAQIAVASSTTNDFATDPFKDYRYEDPFNIKDPFDDDDDDPIADNFSSIIAVAPEQQPPAAAIAAGISNQSVPLNATGAFPKTVTAPVLPLAPQPPSSASSVSPSFANFNNQFGATTSAARHSDFFDAFHDNFNKNDHSASISSLHTATSNGTGTNMLDNAFGGSISSIISSNSNPNNNTSTSSNNCDPFGVPRRSSTTASAASNNNSNNAKAADVAAFATDFNNDFFGGNGFEDEFASSSSSNSNRTSSNVAAGSVKVPNASANLATSMSSSSSTLTGASNNANNKSSSNSSSSDFAKFDSFRDFGSTAPTNGNGFGTSTQVDPFADDDFGAAATAAVVTNDNSQWSNFPSVLVPSVKKVPNKEGVAEALKNPHYAADYSQGEGSFDKDLQEALKRSMVDQ